MPKDKLIFTVLSWFPVMAVILPPEITWYQAVSYGAVAMMFSTVWVESIFRR